MDVFLSLSRWRERFDSARERQAVPLIPSPFRPGSRRAHRDVLSPPSRHTTALSVYRKFTPAPEREYQLLRI